MPAQIHYDDVHFARWKRKDGKAPLRKGEYTVLNKVAQAYRSKLCQRLALPKSVKEVLQRLRDEDAWEKLEHLRKAIALEAQGEELTSNRNEGKEAWANVPTNQKPRRSCVCFVSTNRRALRCWKRGLNQLVTEQLQWQNVCACADELHKTLTLHNWWDTSAWSWCQCISGLPTYWRAP